MGRASSRKRASQRAGLEALREVWADREFGIGLYRSRGNQLRMGWQLDEHEEIVLMGLSRVRALIDEIERENALSLRAAGVSWADIGFFMGMSGEAARKRHAGLEEQLERLEKPPGRERA